MRESDIERKLKVKVEKLGAKVLKFTPQGITGMPDRLILLPGGRTYFVELKAPGKKLRPLQQKRFVELRQLGFDVRMIDSEQLIDDFVKELSL